jgi:hypothetical protein
MMLAAIVGVSPLIASTPAGAVNSLPAPPEARYATASDHAAMPSYADRCAPARRCGEAYVLAATRGLRQSGINPAVAVVLAPATLVVDAVFFPFALALDNLAD